MRKEVSLSRNPQSVFTTLWPVSRLCFHPGTNPCGHPGANPCGPSYRLCLLTAPLSTWCWTWGGWAPSQTHRWNGEWSAPSRTNTSAVPGAQSREVNRKKDRQTPWKEPLTSVPDQMPWKCGEWGTRLKGHRKCQSDTFKQSHNRILKKMGILSERN